MMYSDSDSESSMFGGVVRRRRMPKRAPKRRVKRGGVLLGAGPRNVAAAHRNPWIAFVKNYACKHGIAYNEALKKPRVKEVKAEYDAYMGYGEGYRRPARRVARRPARRVAHRYGGEGEGEGEGYRRPLRRRRRSMY